MRKTELIIFLSVMFVVTLVAFLKAGFVEQHGIVAQVWVTIILVLLTAVYVSRVRQQADASIKMAQETREQRYDSFRPVIDIERYVLEEEKIREGLAARLEEFSYGFWCVLDNIGVGPATDVYSYMAIGGKTRGRDFGTIKIGDSKQAGGLSLQQIGNRRFLVAYYRDIYNRCFESKREVTADKEGPSWIIGPLKHRKLDKTEDSKIIESIWPLSE